MSIRVADFIDVRERAKNLGLQEPDGLVFLPRNFDDVSDSGDFIFEDSMPDVRMLLDEIGVKIRPLVSDNEKPLLIKENDFTWVLPVLYFGKEALTWCKDHPELIKAVVEKLHEYSKTVFAAVVGRTRVRWEIVVETDDSGTTKKVSFDGPAETFPTIQQFMETVLSGDYNSLPSTSGAHEAIEPPAHPQLTLGHAKGNGNQGRQHGVEKLG